MDFITEAIAIGNYTEAEDAALLASFSITGVLCLAPDRIALGAPPNVEKDGWPLEDGTGNKLSDIEVALAKLDGLLGRHGRVLVHCHAGRSRSCGIVAVWVARRNKISLDAALELVSAKRSVMWVTPSFRETLELAVERG